MFEIKIYETPAGNRPFEKYIEKLSKKHKTDEVTEIFNYLDKLSKFGFDINHKFKANAIKNIQDDIYELRPSSSRIFFFCYIDGVFISCMAGKRNKIQQTLTKLKKQLKKRRTF